MGVKCMKSNDTQSNNQYCKSYFNFKQIVGQGSYGEVWKAVDSKCGMIYAIKVMSKLKILAKKSIYSVLKERELLAELHHPFVTNMVGAFQDKQNLYLVMDFMEGGDLRYYIRQKQCISEEEIKFIVMCIVEGLKYLHHKSIIHRDIKPENIMIDRNGYCKIGDLGIARHWKRQNAKQTSGTLGYMAPQVLLHQNHSFTADYYALGMIVYQLVMRRRPFCNLSRKELKAVVMNQDIEINGFSVDFSQECIDFVNKLIKRKPQNRLGYLGISQLIEHPWLKISPTQKKLLMNKHLRSPLTPFFNHKLQTQTKQPTIDYQEASKLVNTPQFERLFQNYDYYDANHKSIKLEVAPPFNKKNKKSIKYLNDCLIE